jgi:hypothetical protein
MERKSLPMTTAVFLSATPDLLYQTNPYPLWRLDQR